MPWTIREYLRPDGTSPYREWLDGLDVVTRARIQARVLRFSLGNLGDHKAVGGRVWGARFPFGPGYRLYFGKHGRRIILLLLGGTNASQAAELRRARQYWMDYQEATSHGTTQ